MKHTPIPELTEDRPDEIPAPPARAIIEYIPPDRDESKALAIIVLSVANVETPPEIILLLRNRIAFLSQCLKDAKKAMDEALIGRILETGQDILLPGDTRLYIGNPPKYKCMNPGNLIAALFILCSGDMEEVGRNLSSDWFKKTEIETRCDGADAKTVKRIRDELHLDNTKDSPRLFDQLIQTIKENAIKEGKPIKPSVLHVDNGYRRGSGKKVQATVIGKAE